MRRVALFSALVLALACGAAAEGLTGPVPFFPAGLPRPDNPFQAVPFNVPSLSATSYRGTYVSGLGGGGGRGAAARPARPRRAPAGPRAAGGGGSQLPPSPSTPRARARPAPRRPPPSPASSPAHPPRRTRVPCATHASASGS
jgi:hypothetical protein